MAWQINPYTGQPEWIRPPGPDIRGVTGKERAKVEARRAELANILARFAQSQRGTPWLGPEVEGEPGIMSDIEAMRAIGIRSQPGTPEYEDLSKQVADIRTRESFEQMRQQVGIPPGVTMETVTPYAALSGVDLDTLKAQLGMEEAGRDIEEHEARFGAGGLEERKVRAAELRASKSGQAQVFNPETGMMEYIGPADKAAEVARGGEEGRAAARIKAKRPMIRNVARLIGRVKTVAATDPAAIPGQLGEWTGTLASAARQVGAGMNILGQRGFDAALTEMTSNPDIYATVSKSARMKALEMQLALATAMLANQSSNNIGQRELQRQLEVNRRLFSGDPAQINAFADELQDQITESFNEQAAEYGQPLIEKPESKPLEEAPRPGIPRYEIDPNTRKLRRVQ